MSNFICASCVSYGSCPRFRWVSETEMRNSHFVFDARNFVHSLGIPGPLLVDTLLNKLSQIEGTFRDDSKIPVLVNLELFESPDLQLFGLVEDLEGKSPEDRRNSLLDWIDYNFGQKWHSAGRAFIQNQRRDHFKHIVSFARAAFWENPRARMLGIRAANDNFKPESEY